MKWQLAAALRVALIHVLVPVTSAVLTVLGLSPECAGQAGDLLTRFVS